MLRIVAIDPGKITGLVSLTIDEEGNLENVEAHEIDHMGVGHYMEMLYGQWRSTGVKPIVVIESFTITAATAKNSPAPWSLETIGIVRYFCDKAGFELVFQTPAQAKRLATDDILKAAGLYFKGNGFAGHANDAARHACYRLMTANGMLQDAIRSTMK